MKSKTGFLSAQVILCAVFVVLLSGCVGKYPLNGVWSGKFDGDNVVVSFFDDICFVEIGQYATKGSFTFEKGAGNVTVDRDSYQFTVKGNTLTAQIEGQSVPLNKDTSSKTSPVIKGVWNGDAGWGTLAFINDKVYFVVNRGGSCISATYTFSGKDGTISTPRWDAKFTVNGNKLEYHASNGVLYFTRAEK